MSGPQSPSADRVPTLIGDVCANWAAMEQGYEILIWWLLRVSGRYGSVITGPLELEKRAHTALKLAPRRIKDDGLILVLHDTYTDIGALKDRRNLMVHGLRFYDERDGQWVARVTRGNLKYKKVPLSDREAKELIDCVYYLNTRLHHFLCKIGAVPWPVYRDDSPTFPLPPKLPSLLTERYRRKGRIPQGYEQQPPQFQEGN